MENIFKNISAVIPTNYERDNIGVIVDMLNGLGFNDIIVENSDNKIYGRYEAIQRARHDIIYTQDDDCLIENIEELANSYDPYKIINNITEEKLLWYANNYPDITLIGWGAVFNKSMIDVLDKYISKYGIDDLLKIEADRVFTFLNSFSPVISDRHIKHLDGYMSGVSNKQDHLQRLELINHRLKSL